MTTAQTATLAIEFALMVDHEDGSAPEYVPANDADHAAQMARTIYAGRPSWTVGREVQPWRFARRSDATLTHVVAK